MLNYAREPDGVFTGSPDRLQALIQRIRTNQGR
jgi:hypothetical protein